MHILAVFLHADTCVHDHLYEFRNKIQNNISNTIYFFDIDK